MSPGNLYRYFPSKDAIVAGLAERDRAAVAEDFGGIEAAPDLMQAFAGLARRHLAEAPDREGGAVPGDVGRGDPQPGHGGDLPGTSSTRSPRASPACTAGRKSAAIKSASNRRPRRRPGGAGPPRHGDGDGIIVRRALSPDFAPGPVIDAMLTLIGAALDGRFDPTGTASPAPPHPEPAR